MSVLIQPIKLILLLFIATYQGAFLDEQDFGIDNAEVSFDFVSKDVQGSIADFQSEIKYKAEQIEQSVFKGSVAVETISTGNFLRDWSLKKSKYFNEEKYPRILFESNDVIRTPDGFSVKGDLTIKGITKRVTIDFKQKGSQLLGTFSLYSSDYGINIKNKREDNLVSVEIDLRMK